MNTKPQPQPQPAKPAKIHKKPFVIDVDSMMSERTRKVIDAASAISKRKIITNAEKKIK